MKLATGVDIIEIERVRGAIARHGERFLSRIFTLQELEQTQRKPASLAVRFAAKEAVAKALGTGIGRVQWTEIEVVYGASHQPHIELHGAAGHLACELGLETWSVSLSHTSTLAIAFVVAGGKTG